MEGKYRGLVGLGGWIGKGDRKLCDKGRWEVSKVVGNKIQVICN